MSAFDVATLGTTVAMLDGISVGASLSEGVRLGMIDG